MKNKLALATLFMTSALVVTGCNDDVTLKKNGDGKYIIFSLDKSGYEYVAEDLLNDMQDSSSATATLYNEVARKVFTAYGEEVFKGKTDSIESDAADKVSDFKEDCKTQAKEAGEDYDTYLEDKLEELGVEDITALQKLYYYQGLKSKLEEDYIEDHYNYFLKQYLATYTPFQVKHILVAANSSDSKFATGTMTADNSRKLLKILDKFVEDGESFANIAKFTDDTSSADDGGVMPFNQAQNYVPEFRFATYVQEVFENNQTAEARYAAAKKLHLIDEEKTTQEEFVKSNLYKVYDGGVGLVSLNEINNLKNSVTNTDKGGYNYFKADGSNKDGLTAEDIPTYGEQPYEMNVSKYNDEGELNQKYYEEWEMTRNIIFNKTLNSHKLQYIELDAATVAKMDTHSNKNYYTFPAGTLHAGKTVLADDSGNPIFVAIASTGVHFMSMVYNTNDVTSSNVSVANLSLEARTSLFNLYNKIAEADGLTKVANVEAMTTEQYNTVYFTLYDSKYTSDLTMYQYTYIGRNGTYANKSNLQSASKSLLDDVKSYVSNVEYYIFDGLVEGYGTVEEGLIKDFNNKKITIAFTNDTADKKVWNSIKTYVTDKLTSTNDSFYDSVVNAAEEYGAKLAREQEVKSAMLSWPQYQ